MRNYKLYLIITTVIIIGFKANYLYGQNAVVENPRVEHSFSSENGSTKVSRIVFTDKYTYVYVKYRKYSKTDDLSISISLSTTLRADNGRKQRVLKWGVFSESGKEIYLDFDKSYSLGEEIEVDFFLKFPQIPLHTNKIDVVENINNGFFWRGISVISPKRKKENFSKNDNLEEGSNVYSSNRQYDDEHIYSSKHRREGYPNNEHDFFTVNASGSGFAINKEGHIATCYHVVQNARKIRIRGVNGDFSKPLFAEIVLLDEKNDLAILQISDEHFSGIKDIPYGIKSGISDVGENIFVLGYPLRAVMGDEIKLTNGIISANSGFQGDTTEYQISAVVQSGNSGCPLFNHEGDVIGVVNARLKVEGAAYAVKGKYLNNLYGTLKREPAMSKKTGKEFIITELVKERKSFVYIVEVE